MKYCESIYTYKRRPTHEVMVGDIGIGANNPIRTQSMTTSDTMDTDATVAEVIQLAEAGCEIVRITAPSVKDAKNLYAIKKMVRAKGHKVPLVADIHFTPNAALVAAEIVEKVRINPGNYADKKRFEVRDYTDNEYESELVRIAERFAPLVSICKTNGVAMRIGVNHGSLSDRVMNRFGDTPEGMVESALEFVRICEELSYRDIIISMKSSNPQVMIEAYRLLAQKMYSLGMTYPYHLGVTEAGDGEDGRIKSAVGIGTLLEDGIGDTIRVSLTEDAIYEVPVADALVKKYNEQVFTASVLPKLKEADYLHHFRPENPIRVQANEVTTSAHTIGGKNPVQVFMADKGLSPEYLASLLQNDAKPEWVVAIENSELSSSNLELTFVGKNQPLSFTPVNFSNGEVKNQLIESVSAVTNLAFYYCSGFEPQVFNIEMAEEIIEVLSQKEGILAIECPAEQLGALTAIRQFLALLQKHNIQMPIVLAYKVQDAASDWQLDAASVLGSLLTSGIGSGVYIHGDVNAEDATRFSYNLLQATRLRITKTEYISCPSCGRTLFDLQSTTEKIKDKTSHLKGVKIAIMGCIVNGPGEMADADFGYVGSGHGKINLFVGKICVQQNIPQAEAGERLIQLIKEHGMWVDAPVEIV
ncbi:MAG: 4-hydroxy-3-methylbut-2-en-1-yl diphosphate synthase [Calditrichaeota bacterium]|nr:MAG: 4-hydroxy-3-methylbut-2-en-1-yl diphosphate synthase [Calditrichota bacterium]